MQQRRPPPPIQHHHQQTIPQGGYSPPVWLRDALRGYEDRFPSSRYQLSQQPTPVYRWNLSAALLPPELGIELYIKRDDFTGMELSGNKIRKLEFILADAIAKGCDSVVTLGGIQSNHCRATAVAARMLGLDAHLVLRGPQGIDDPGVDGNLLIERMVGAKVYLVTKEEYARHGQEKLGKALVEQLVQDGARNPYLIVVGGSSMLGTHGYIHMVEELEGQSRDMGGIQWDYVVSACGSGGTTAGLGLGIHLSEYFSGTTCLGYMVCDTERYFSDYIQNIYHEMGFSKETSAEIIASSIQFSQAKGAGYAMSRKEELETIAQIARDSCVLLDPVYTGKAMHGLLRDIRENPNVFRNKKILFCHTGGLFSYASSQRRDIEPFIQGESQRFCID
jgi:D-cysteine desulfhydrase